MPTPSVQSDSVLPLSCSVKNQPKVKTPVTHVDSKGVADSGDETEPHDAGLLKLLQSVSYRL